MIILNQSATVIVLFYIICTPMITPVRRKISVSHAYCIYDQITCKLCSLSGYIFVLPTADIYKPSTTMLRMPDTFTHVN
jgi:multidrug transporter EmrE-like cation transporter